MNNDIMPITVVPSLPIDNGIEFLCKNDQIEIQGDYSDVIWKIIQQANGFQTTEEIASAIKEDIYLVNGIVSDLISLNIMYDSRELYLHFHDVSKCPDSYARDLSLAEVIEHTNSPRERVKDGVPFHFDVDDDSVVAKYIKKRSSCRSFSSYPLSKNEICNICHYAYSRKIHAVPSGGGLYPLKLFVLVEKNQNDLPSGYYEYDADNDLLILFEEEIDASSKSGNGK